MQPGRLRGWRPLLRKGCMVAAGWLHGGCRVVTGWVQAGCRLVTGRGAARRRGGSVGWRGGTRARRGRCSRPRPRLSAAPWPAGRHRTGSRRCLGVQGRRVGDIGRAARPHRSLPSGPERLNGSSRVGATKAGEPAPGDQAGEPASPRRPRWGAVALPRHVTNMPVCARRSLRRGTQPRPGQCAGTSAPGRPR